MHVQIGASKAVVPNVQLDILRYLHMKGTSNSSDLAGRLYWDQVWRRTPGHSVGRYGYFDRELAREFRRLVRPGISVCEVGCADSRWIPFLIRQGAQVAGLDYSDVGIRRLKTQLASSGLSAELVLGDMFQQTALGYGRFDLVFSVGLVEHFRDGISAVGALARLLRPSGVLLTIIPNMVGLWGSVQKHLDRSIYDLHVPYTPDRLDDLHRSAGLEVLDAARFFGGFGPLVMNAPGLAETYPRLHRLAVAVMWPVQQAVAWPAGLLFGRRSESELLSSHVFGVYRRSH
jgi:SAM-dependent methyltransferase